MEKAISNIEIFAAHISNAIYISKNKTEINNSDLKQSFPESIVGQIRELFSMKENGIITDEEFNSAKLLLISGN